MQRVHVKMAAALAPLCHEPQETLVDETAFAPHIAAPQVPVPALVAHFSSRRAAATSCHSPQKLCLADRERSQLGLAAIMTNDRVYVQGIHCYPDSTPIRGVVLSAASSQARGCGRVGRYGRSRLIFGHQYYTLAGFKSLTAIKALRISFDQPHSYDKEETCYVGCFVLS